MFPIKRSAACLRQSKSPLATAVRQVTTKQILSKNPPIATSSHRSLQHNPRPLEQARYEQYYDDVLAQDMLVMTYVPHTTGEVRSTKVNALRSWDGSSPYHKGRPLRALRGGKPLAPLPVERTFRNVPKITEIYVHCMVKEAMEDKDKLLSVYMALQTMTGAKPEFVRAKTSVQPWRLRVGMPIGVKVKLQGPPMMNFLATLFEVVLPSLKDFTGVADSTGDTTGNLAFGLPETAMARFPEIEVNYEQYPVLSGFHVIVNTSAQDDREARQLLSGFGLPFKSS